MPITINFKVPESMNEERIKLNVTWRDVLKAGLEALKNEKADPLAALKEQLRPHLLAANKAIKTADDLMKEAEAKQKGA